MSEDKRQILVVEDNRLNAKMFEAAIKAMGMHVCGIADTASGAIDLALKNIPDAILMDVRLIGEADGVDAALAIQRETPHPRIIYITGSNEPETMDRINQNHPAAILIKPVMTDQLQRTIREVLARPDA